MSRVRNWRWLRLAVPIAVVVAVFVTTAVVHALQQADPGDKDYLNPDSRAAIGSSRLAEALRAQGVTVRKVSTTFEASTTLWAEPDSTLFVTAPEFTDVAHLTETRWLTPSSHIVLVRPDDRFLDQTTWPATTAGERWTAAAPAAGCGLFTGQAAVRKLQYRTDALTCYQGGVVQFPVSSLAPVTLIGAADPFRNDRIDEHDNRAFALFLLSRKRQVIWLDRHEPDRWPTSDGPPVTDRPAPDGLGDDPATSSPAEDAESYDDGESGSETEGGSESTDEDSGQDERPPRAAEPDGAAQQAREQANAFPPKVWAVVLLVLLAGAAFAAAAARRLGTPVAERLPSRVPANETMLGHARLYQRGGSRLPSLNILRRTTLRRITDHLGLPPDATDDDLARASGLPVERFTEVFAPDGERLRRDSHLVAATKQLRDLERDVLNEGETQ